MLSEAFQSSEPPTLSLHASRCILPVLISLRFMAKCSRCWGLWEALSPAQVWTNWEIRWKVNNTEIHGSKGIFLREWFHFLWTYRNGIFGWYGSSIFNFLRKFHTLFHRGCTILHLTNRAQGSQFLYILTHTYFLFLLVMLMAVRWLSLWFWFAFP